MKLIMKIYCGDCRSGSHMQRNVLTNFRNIKLCLHVTSGLRQRQTESDIMNGFHGTKWRCLHFALTIDSIQNFDANIDADAHENVTCKQSFKGSSTPTDSVTSMCSSMFDGNKGTEQIFVTYTPTDFIA